MVKTAATATKLLDANTTCGFSSNGVLSAPTNVTGASGEQGSITWAVNACAIGPLPDNTTIATDCVGTMTKVSGTFTGTATKMVSGLRGTSPPIVPVTRTAAVFTVQSINMTTLDVGDAAMGTMRPSVHSSTTGIASLVVNPVAGESSTNAGVYSIGTPVAHVTGLTMPMGTMTLFNNGSQFNLDLTNVALAAQAGSYQGASNTIQGSLTVDGQPVMLAAQPLVAGFTQAAFDATYVFTQFLKRGRAPCGPAPFCFEMSAIAGSPRKRWASVVNAPFRAEPPPRLSKGGRSKSSLVTNVTSSRNMPRRPR